MRTTKKKTSFLLAILLVLILLTAIPLATQGFAADAPTLKTTVYPERVSQNGTFTVTVSLAEKVTTRGFGLDFETAYDHTAFEWVGGDWSDDIKAQSVMAPTIAGAHAAFTTLEAMDVSGVIYTFVLKPVGSFTCRDSAPIKVTSSNVFPTEAQGDTVLFNHIYDNPADAICNSCDFVRALPTYVHALHRGDEVTVSVTLDKAVESTGFGLDLLYAYDHERFEWISGDWCETVTDGALLQKTNAGSEAAFATDEPIALSGEIFSFVLKVKEDAPFGDYDVVVTPRGNLADAKLSTTAITVHECTPSATASYDGESHWYSCITYGCTAQLAKTPHVFENEEDTKCDCGYEKRDYLLGDTDGNGKVDMDDAIYLLFHYSFPEGYPIQQPTNYDGIGLTDMDDAIYLLFHYSFPEGYPLHDGNVWKWPLPADAQQGEIQYPSGRPDEGVQIPVGGWANNGKISAFAASAGVVVKAEYHSDWGNLVVIEHEDGYLSYYAHLHSVTVSVGDKLAAGDKIGLVGGTGATSTVNLYFIIARSQGDGEPVRVNPLDYVTQPQ